MIGLRPLASALALLGAVHGAAGEPDAGEPTRYGQTREAVIDLITRAAAKGRSLSGQQVNEYEVFIDCTSFERIYELTGQWPAILGLELMFIIENPSYRQHFMARLTEHARRGGIVTLTWHARNPIKVCPRGEYYGCSLHPMTEQELGRVLDPATREHALWSADVEVIAGVLEDLQAMGVAPLLRPYHEMNGDWFWWGRKRAYTDLWRALHDRLAGDHGLGNLIWVWSPDKAPADADRYFPGEDYVDLVGADIYAQKRSSAVYEAARDNVAPLHESGLFAFTEIGLLPTIEIFRDVGPAWFLLWGGEFINRNWSPEPCSECNDAEAVAEVYGLEEVLTLDELKWPDATARGVDLAARTAAPKVSCPASLL